MNPETDKIRRLNATDPMDRIRLTRAQAREIDRLAVEQYHMPSILLMENAARAVTDVALDMLRGIDGPRVLIVCGGGNNGGDGLAVARHLHNLGVGVELALAADPQGYAGDALVNWRIALAMSMPHLSMEAATARLATGAVDLLIDALYGTGLSTAPRQPRWIELMNAHGAPVLAVDLPSGLDSDTGQPLGLCVRAVRTVTFVAEKAGFANPAARQYLGDVTVGDIGAPRELIGRLQGLPDPA
jgi:NAD(P)H-hydrate epimerase